MLVDNADIVCQNHDFQNVCMALFGLGRAGSNHLANIIGNARVDLKYVVDLDEDRYVVYSCAVANSNFLQC